MESESESEVEVEVGGGGEEKMKLVEEADCRLGGRSLVPGNVAKISTKPSTGDL